MLTIRTFVNITGNSTAELYTTIIGTVTWNRYDYYGSIEAKSSPETFIEGTIIAPDIEVLEEIGATFFTDGLGKVRFNNSGSGSLNYTIIYPFYYIWRNLEESYCITLSDFWLTNASNNIYSGVIFPMPANTQAYYDASVVYKDMAEYEKENNAIVVYNYLRQRELNKWSLSSVSCICALMDCATGFNGASGRLQVGRRNSFVSYGVNIPATGTCRYSLIDPWYIPAMQPWEETDVYRGICGFPFIGLQYYANLQLLYGDRFLYRRDLYTLESALALWDFEYLNSPQYDTLGGAIWNGIGEGHKPLHYFVNSDDEPEELAVLLYTCLNRNGKVKITTPLYGTEEFNNTTRGLNGTYSAQCLIDKARKWYDFLKQFEPKPRKKHKMPLWEYLRYTV